MGRTKSFHTERFADKSALMTNTLPDGSQVSVQRGANEQETATLADGTVSTTSLSGDPLWGISSPITSTNVRFPSGLTFAETRTRTVTQTDPVLPFSMTSQTDRVVTNGRTTNTVYTANTRTAVTTTPGNRIVRRVLDVVGRTSQLEVNGLTPVTIGYDPSGRLSAITQGTRTTSFGYFGSGPTNGMLASVNNAVGNQTALTLDNAGRIVAETRGGATTGFGWDAAGLLTSLTPPGGSAHAMAHTPVDLLESYTPPAAGITQPVSSYTYNLDRQLTQSARPDGIAVDRTYDVAGRLESISLPGGVIQLGYVPAGSGQGHVSDLTGPYGVDLAFGYDGSLPTTTTWSGSVAGSISHTFNSDLRVTRQTVSGASGTSQAAFGYDADTLLTCASPATCNPVSSDALKLTRSPQHGLVTQLDQGSSREVRTYNNFGELATQVGTYGGAPRMSLTYHTTAKPRDALGRVVDKLETVGSTTSNWHYTYDALGRLTDVTLNGSAAEHFTYDTNGNRTSYQSPSTGTLSATYDAQDRLLTYGGWQYTYGANGEIESKTNTTTGAETLYQYDALGNLLGVWLPNGDVVEYLVDGIGRRVGKKLNGVVTRQWLYRDGLKPVAELNGAGTLQKQFVYGSHPLVPEFVVAGGITYRVMSDQLGSPRVLIDVATGTVQQQMRHSAFGAVLEDTNPGFTPFGFAGGMYDEDTGLVRFGARDYDPSVGRWVSKDPIGFGGGQANLFVYVAGDPVNRVDPKGQWYIDINVTLGLPIGNGFTAGVLLTQTGAHVYGGGGPMTPGAGGGLFWSPQDVTPGMNFAASGAFGAGGSMGTDAAGTPFWEVGLGTNGLSETAYYVSDELISWGSPTPDRTLDGAVPCP